MFELTVTQISTPYNLGKTSVHTVCQTLRWKLQHEISTMGSISVSQEQIHPQVLLGERLGHPMTSCALLNSWPWVAVALLNKSSLRLRWVVEVWENDSLSGLNNQLLKLLK